MQNSVSREKVDFVLCLQLPSGKNVCSRLAHMKRCVLPSSQSNLAVKTRCLCYSPRKELSLLLCHRSPKARKRTNGYQKMVQTCYTDGSRKLDTFPEIEYGCFGPRLHTDILQSVRSGPGRVQNLGLTWANRKFKLSSRIAFCWINMDTSSSLTHAMKCGMALLYKMPRTDIHIDPWDS